ncbi:hypothetical protein [Neolewinella agarilytica]|uniref:hypothetical protein n=1 Tax=Neolewinella agarilytica TaxID=478744 RepID=UPI002357DDA6|nr:hypothetical protein [Neolewinella agarilytica]
MRLLLLLPALLLMVLAGGCTPDQLDLSREAEMAYVDLLFALHHDQKEEAAIAADNLDFFLRQMHGKWPRPLKMEQLDNHLFHIGRAEWAYDDALESVEKGDLALARVQLDRATYEFSAAAPAAFHELYIGEMYAFVTTWLEVEQAAGDQELCSLNWDQFSQYAHDAKSLWKQDRYNRPDSRAYAMRPIDEATFDKAHQGVQLELDAFIDILKSGDQCHAREKATAVSAAVWELVNLFGSREGNAL